MESTWKNIIGMNMGSRWLLPTHQTPTPTPFKRGHQLTEKDQFSWSWTRIFRGVSWAFETTRDTNFHGTKFHCPGWPAGRCAEWGSVWLNPPNLRRYCWWKKSCTSWYGKYPIIYKVLYGFIYARWCRISSINRYDWMSAAVLFLNVSFSRNENPSESPFLWDEMFMNGFEFAAWWGYAMIWTLALFMTYDTVGFGL